MLPYMYSLFASETKKNVMRHKNANANATNTTTHPPRTQFPGAIFIPKIKEANYVRKSKTNPQCIL